MSPTLGHTSGFTPDLKEEPYELVYSRTDLCGGRLETAVPTAIKCVPPQVRRSQADAATIRELFELVMIPQLTRLKRAKSTFGDYRTSLTKWESWWQAGAPRLPGHVSGGCGFESRQRRLEKPQ